MLCLFLRFLSRISIHALLAESDRHRAAPTRPGWAFLSTLSLRRATTRGQGAPLGIPYFYPRSPCGERRAAYSQWTPPIYFYPRSPCGERPPLADGAQPDAAISIHALLAESDRHWQMGHSLTRQFLSTLSLRRATTSGATYLIFLAFLSTLSLRRATVSTEL